MDTSDSGDHNPRNGQRGPNDEEWAEFLDRLVHDIREPLRTVTAFSELLRETAGKSIGEEGEHILGQILAGASAMGNLIGCVSSYSLALRPPAASETASLQLAFNMAVMSLDAQIQGSGATVTGDGLPKVGLSLARSTQLLESLIQNALLYRREAPPLVQVSAEEDSAGGWTVRVQDNGIGIDAADREAVFKPFRRLQGRKYPGAGLGLAACRKIVEAHGGAIRIEPASDGGSVCVFTLPAPATD